MRQTSSWERSARNAISARSCDMTFCSRVPPRRCSQKHIRSPPDRFRFHPSTSDCSISDPHANRSSRRHFMKRRDLIQALAVAPLALAMPAFSLEGPELYAGEKALYEAAAKEGLVVSFDTGPEWANWKALFRDFKKRYPELEITYNDLGSAATVVALE